MACNFCDTWFDTSDEIKQHMWLDQEKVLNRKGNTPEDEIVEYEVIGNEEDIDENEETENISFSENYIYGLY